MPAHTHIHTHTFTRRFLVHLDDSYTSRQFGRVEQVKFTKQADVEVKNRLVTLEMQNLQLRQEFEVVVRQREALMEEQRRAARKREAKDQLMVRLYT